MKKLYKQEGVFDILNMNRQKVYLSGKISGEPELGKPKFHAAASKLRFKGLDVINPHELPDNHHNKSWEAYMRECYKSMMNVEAVIVLPCWKKSRGARREVLVAEWLKIEIVNYADFTPVKMPLWMKLGVILNIL